MTIRWQETVRAAEQAEFEATPVGRLLAALGISSLWLRRARLVQKGAVWLAWTLVFRKLKLIAAGVAATGLILVFAVVAALVARDRPAGLATEAQARSRSGKAVGRSVRACGERRRLGRRNASYPTSSEVSSVVASTVRATSGFSAAAPSRSRVRRHVVPAGRNAGGSWAHSRPAGFLRPGAHRGCPGGRSVAPAPLSGATVAASPPSVRSSGLPRIYGRGSASSGSGNDCGASRPDSPQWSAR